MRIIIHRLEDVVEGKGWRVMSGGGMSLTTMKLQLTLQNFQCCKISSVSIVIPCWMRGGGSVKSVKCYPCWPSVSAALFLQQFYSDGEIDNYSSQLVTGGRSVKQLSSPTGGEQLWGSISTGNFPGEWWGGAWEGLLTTWYTRCPNKNFPVTPGSILS